MERRTAAIEIAEGKRNDFRTALGKAWPALTALMDETGVYNMSVWNVEELVFVYYEQPDGTPVTAEQGEKLDAAMEPFAGLCRWIARPGDNMRLMYEDFGYVRESKELISYRVFITHLKPGQHEEYKRRHDELAAKRTEPTKGPTSNFSIWNGEDFIFGYSEIDTTMEKVQTEEMKQYSINWETKMLEIMDWRTNDVDWITGLSHPAIERIAHFR